MQTVIAQPENETRNLNDALVTGHRVNGHFEARESKNVIGTLSTSKIYQDYERAFSEATGLPVALRSG